jgi:dienelactone hydrolase
MQIALEVIHTNDHSPRWGAPMRRERDEQEVAIPCDGLELAGTLGAAETARQVVLFADDAASGLGQRNRRVARALHDRGIATLEIDLLTAEEKPTAGDSGPQRSDLDRVSRRLVAAADWLAADQGYAHGSIGCFGSETGAAAALIAAARRPALVGAVVVRGGFLDLAADILHAVRAPTLLIVGGADPDLLPLNRTALTRLRSESALEVVPGATHLFSEPGALDRVADLAGLWFHQNLWEIWPRSAEQPANL